MKLFVKNKVVSFGGNSDVLDEEGKKVYQVKGKVFSATKKKYVCDMEGNPIFMVRNKYWHLIRKSIYIYDVRDGKNEKMCRIFAPVFAKWKIKNYGDNNFEIQGGIFSKVRGIMISEDGKDLGAFSRNVDLAMLFDVRDSYVVDVYEPDADAFLVAAAVGLDNIYDDWDNK